MENEAIDQARGSSHTETPIYETVLRLWRAHGRTVPRPPTDARPERGWVRVDPATYRQR